MTTNPVLMPEPIHRPDRKGLKQLTFMERTVVHRGDPRSMIFSLIGAIWAFYFLWMHNWFSALSAVVLSAVLGRLFSANLDENSYARTIMGKMQLLHLHPMNVIVQSMGVLYLIYAVWTHSGFAIMVASSIVLAGHLWGWHKVNDSF